MKKTIFILNNFAFQLSIILSFQFHCFAQINEEESQKRLSIIDQQCKSCDQWQDIDVCFLDGKFKSDYNSVLVDNPGSCHGAKPHIINNELQFLEVFIKYTASCKRFKNIYFYGHGTEVNFSHNITQLMQNNKININRISCAVSNNAEINFHSCHIGNKCDGKRQMTSYANALLNNKEGTIIAPRTYAISDIFGILPLYSNSYAYTKLEKTESHFSIEAQGLGDFNKNCFNEINDLNFMIQFYLSHLQKNNCSQNISNASSGFIKNKFNEYTVNLKELNEIQLQISNMSQILEKQTHNQQNLYNTLLSFPTMKSFKAKIIKTGSKLFSTCKIMLNYYDISKSKNDDLNRLKEIIDKEFAVSNSHIQSMSPLMQLESLGEDESRKSNQIRPFQNPIFNTPIIVPSKTIN